MCCGLCSRYMVSWVLIISSLLATIGQVTQPWHVCENCLQLVEHFSTWRGPQSDGVGWLTQTTGPSTSEKLDGGASLVAQWLRL